MHKTLLGGALFQLCLSILLPTQWAIVPTACFILITFINGVIDASKNPVLTPAAYLANVVPGRVSPQLPSLTGDHGFKSGAQIVVVFHVGVQWNHPLGARCPGGPEVFAMFRALATDIAMRRDELGLLSVSRWQNNDGYSAEGKTTMLTYYFKDEASIRKFAHEDMHRKAWNWYTTLKTNTHIGVFHETFAVPPHAYEAIYFNCSPLLLGNGMDRCKTEQGEKWVNTLVKADHPNLKTANGRMGRDAKGNVRDY